MKKRHLALLIFLAFTVFYFLGPSPSIFKIELKLPSNFPTDYSQLEKYIQEKESVFNIKPQNESKIYWANQDSMTPTEYSLVYLHGFSASPGEGLPVHTEIAKKYGMNLYVPRLDGHGLIEEEALLDFSGAQFINSAYEAIKTGELLGEKVIVMSCSTGGTASLFNLAHSDVNVHAQILYSPNIKLADSKAGLLTIPWGLQIARLVKGGDYNIWEVPEAAKKHWHGKYRLEALVELQNMLHYTMTKETFHKVDVPSFIGYYFKNEQNQDDVVSTKAIIEMARELSISPRDLKLHAFENVDAHALQSQYFSKDLPSVLYETELFLTKTLSIKKPE